MASGNLTKENTQAPDPDCTRLGHTGIGVETAQAIAKLESKVREGFAELSGMHIERVLHYSCEVEFRHGLDNKPKGYVVVPPECFPYADKRATFEPMQSTLAKIKGKHIDVPYTWRANLEVNGLTISSEILMDEFLIPLSHAHSEMHGIVVKERDAANAVRMTLDKEDRDKLKGKEKRRRSPPLNLKFNSEMVFNTFLDRLAAAKRETDRLGIGRLHGIGLEVGLQQSLTLYMLAEAAIAGKKIEPQIASMFNAWMEVEPQFFPFESADFANLFTWHGNAGAEIDATARFPDANLSTDLLFSETQYLTRLPEQHRKTVLRQFTTLFDCHVTALAREAKGRALADKLRRMPGVVEADGQVAKIAESLHKRPEDFSRLSAIIRA